MSTHDLGIFIADGRTAFQPGETLEVSALWALAGAPERLEVRLFWYTRGKGTEDVGVVESERLENPPAAGEHRWRFPLPAQPWSFSGKLISLVWAVELVVEPGERVARAEFTLSPDGREILLHGESGEADVSARSGG
jgi:hypothetical protein